jgi:hypothetical protein
MQHETTATGCVRTWRGTGLRWEVGVLQPFPEGPMKTVVLGESLGQFALAA